jgi:hypothetical protein
MEETDFIEAREEILVLHADYLEMEQETEEIEGEEEEANPATQG